MTSTISRLFYKYFSAFFFSIFIIIFLYTFYKCEVIWYGKNRAYYNYYYIFSSCILLFSISSIFFSNKIKQYFFIFFVSIFLLFYSFEIYLTFNISSNDYKTKLYKKNSGKNFDQRTKSEVFNDFIKKNDEHVIAFPPQLFLPKTKADLFPLSGHSNVKTLHCNENGYYSTYLSDRFGFNNPDSEWNNENIEFLLIGDSFVHGACVNRPNDITSKIRKYSGKTALNLGYSGNGPLIEYATLKEYFPKSVKNILWFYYEDNDNYDLNRELSNPILLRYLEDDKFNQNLKYSQDKINLLINTNIKNIDYKNNIILKIIKLTKIRFLIKRGFLRESKSNEINPIINKLFKKIKNFASVNNSKLYFVYLPTYIRYIDQNYKNNNLLKIKYILNELDITVIDIHKEVFRKEDDPLELFPFGMSGHYNEAGYSKISKAIYKFVNKN